MQRNVPNLTHRLPQVPPPIPHRMPNTEIAEISLAEIRLNALNKLNLYEWRARNHAEQRTDINRYP